MVQGILILVIFVLIAGLMFANKMPTFLAMILMGVAVACVSGMPLMGAEGILSGVIEVGTINMASSVVALICGSWMGEIMMSTGITRELIRRVAKIGKGRPVLLAVILSFTVTFLFTAVNGLGAVIMIGSLVLPVLMTAGIDAAAAGVIMNYAKSLGGMLNIIQWSVYMSVLGIEASVVKPYGITVLIVGSAGLLLFIFFEVYIKGKKNPQAIPYAAQAQADEEAPVSRGVMLGLLTPLLPILLIMGFQWPIVSALLVSCLYSAFVTSGKDIIKTLQNTAVAGAKAAAPSVLILISIGIVIVAVKSPFVSESMNLLLSNIIPTGRIGYILFFGLLAPLSLYRGPLSIWGLGAGVMALIVSLDVLPMEAVVAAFIACHIFAAGADPTFSLQVWIADQCKVDSIALTKKAFFYLWGVTAVSIVIFSFMTL